MKRFFALSLLGAVIGSSNALADDSLEACIPFSCTAYFQDDTCSAELDRESDAVAALPYIDCTNGFRVVGSPSEPNPHKPGTEISAVYNECLVGGNRDVGARCDCKVVELSGR